MRTALVVAFLLANAAALGVAEEATAVAGAPPAGLVMYVRLGTGDVYLTCIDGSARFSASCFQEDDRQAWNVARCGAEGCEYRLPIEITLLRSRAGSRFEYRARFDHEEHGTYFVTYTRTSRARPWDTASAWAVVQRGPHVYPAAP